MKTIAILAVLTLAACTTTERATLRADGKAIVAAAKQSALQVIAARVTSVITKAIGGIVP